MLVRCTAIRRLITNLLEGVEEDAVGPVASVDGAVDQPHLVDLEPFDRGVGVDRSAVAVARRKVDRVWARQLVCQYEQK